MKAFSAPHNALPLKRLGVSWNLEGAQMVQLTPPDQRDPQPHDAVFCSSSWEGRREGECCARGTYPPKHPLGVTAFWGRDGWMDRYLSAPGTTELIPLCACLLCAASAFPAKLSSSQPRSFHTFTLPLLLLILPERVTQWLRGAAHPLQLTHP